MPDVSLDEFYECLKSKMEKYRGTCDVNKIQNAHCAAVRKCVKDIMGREEKEYACLR